MILLALFFALFGPIAWFGYFYFISEKHYFNEKIKKQAIPRLGTASANIYFEWRRKQCWKHVQIMTKNQQASNKMKTAVLFFHGSSSDVHKMDRTSLFLANKFLNAHVYIPEYRGYSYLYQHPLFSFEEQQKHVDQWFTSVILPERFDCIIFIGHSLGTIFASYLASKHGRKNQDKLYLLSPIYSWFLLQWRQYQLINRWIPTLSQSFDIARTIQENKIETVCIHSQSDESVPFEHSRRCANNHPQIKLITLESVSHSDLKTMLKNIL